MKHVVMSSWSFWDWLTYSCIAIAAAALAADQAIKSGAPAMRESLHWLIGRPAWSYAPLALIMLSGLLMVAKQIGVLGTTPQVQPGLPDREQQAESRYIKTSLRLQFFGDHRIPHEVASDNVASWFAYFSASLSITPKGAHGNTMAGGMEIPPRWAVFIAFDKPAKFRQAIVSFSNPEVMPITDVLMANSRVIVISTRGEVPAGVLSIHAAE